MRNLIFLIPLVGVLTFNSCKKYEEGPRISISSKKGRVANTWKIDKRFENTREVTLSSEEISTRLVLEKDGIARRTTNNTSFAGSWAFEEDKEQLVINLVGTNLGIPDNKNYKIIRLKKDEMWLEYVDNSGDIWQTRYVEVD